MVPVGDRSPLGLSFTVEVDAASDLAFEDVRADALLTVVARSAAQTAPAPRTAEILIMDRSLSMKRFGKLDEAKRAMCTAIDALQDGTYLGIVAGHHQAEVVFPTTGGLARVDADTKAAAKLQVANQLPEGGTAIGEWLACADRLFASAAAGDTVCHAVLYTDGNDEHETPEQLGSVLAACTDRFVCDARGLGEDWNYTELLRITQALHGTAAAVVTVSDLTADFTRLMEQARRIVVPRVYLGLRLNHRFQLGFVRQTRPVEADLTAQQQEHEGEIHIPLGSWPPEVRQYHLSLRFGPDALPVDEDLRAARITLHAAQSDGTRRPCAESRAMVVRRRATPGFETLLPSELTRVESERELGMAMRACADAWQRGDRPTADMELRSALVLAERLQDDVRLRLLRAVAVTGPDGRLRLRDVTRGEMQQLGLDSTRTGPVPADPDGLGARPDAAALRRSCPRCGDTTSARLLQHCENCGHRFDDAAGDGTAPDAGAAHAGPAEGGPAEGGPAHNGPPGDRPHGGPRTDGPRDLGSGDDGGTGHGPRDAS